MCSVARFRRGSGGDRDVGGQRAEPDAVGARNGEGSGSRLHSNPRRLRLLDPLGPQEALVHVSNTGPRLVAQDAVNIARHCVSSRLQLEHAWRNTTRAMLSLHKELHVTCRAISIQPHHLYVCVFGLRCCCTFYILQSRLLGLVFFIQFDRPRVFIVLS